MTGDYSGSVIGARLSQGRARPLVFPLDTFQRASTTSVRCRGSTQPSTLLQVVLGAYGGMALYWLNSMPAEGQRTSSKPLAPAEDGVIFSAEEEFLQKDQAEFLEAAAQMELEDEEDGLVPTHNPRVKLQSKSMHRHTTSGTSSRYHDEALFHRTANLEHGAAAAGQYGDDHESPRSSSPAREPERQGSTQQTSILRRYRSPTQDHHSCPAWYAYGWRSCC